MGRRLRDLTGPHVAVAPAEEVTSRNGAAEVGPREASLGPADVEAIWRSVVDLYETGLHPAIALCLRRRGRVVLDRAIGHVSGNAPGDRPNVPKVRATPQSLFNLFSASKAVTAMVVHHLDERGLLHLDDAVVEHIPEFGKHGKQSITVRQLLTHRAGIPAIPGAPTTLDLLASPERVLEILCDAKPLSVPGRQLSYHALTAGFVLGAIVERVSGRDIRRYLRENVLDPLGFRSFDYGVAPERLSEVAQHARTGLPPTPPLSWMLERALGVDMDTAVELSNDARFLTAIIPSGNVVGTADEASRFFQVLLDAMRGRVPERERERIFAPRTVRRAIAEQSYLEMDSFLGLPVRYGMGFILGADRFSLYGPRTPRAFGHVGFTNVVAWADPDRELAVGLMTSGKPFVTPGQLHWLNVLRTIAQRCAP
ncbi:MAG: beta-lactamase family protein, partial [Deltaproteobacteria bacterium]|nr:beta-lactamase family protein [Deltaproteobacteria bacterium]